MESFFKCFYQDLGFEIVYERLEDKFCFMQLENNQIMLEDIGTDFSDEMIKTANNNLKKSNRINIKFKQMDNLKMDSLTEFLIDNISNLISYRNIANKLIEDNINTNDKTIASYINYLCDAFAFYRVRRYDIQEWWRNIS